jgi:hypothetical protein
MTKLPAGTTTISGQSAQSLNAFPGCRAHSSIGDSATAARDRGTLTIGLQSHPLVADASATPLTRSTTRTKPTSMIIGIVARIIDLKIEIGQFKPNMRPASSNKGSAVGPISGGPHKGNRAAAKLGLLSGLVKASGIGSYGIATLLQAGAENQIMVHVILLGPEHGNRAICLFMTGSERCSPLLSVILLRRGGHGKRLPTSAAAITEADWKRVIGCLLLE